VLNYQNNLLIGKLYLTGNIVISEVDALMCVVLNKPEKHVHYGQLVVPTESKTLLMRCRTKRGLYNQV